MMSSIESSPPAKPRGGEASRFLIVFIATVAILYFGKEVLLPVTLAVILAFLLAPLVSLFERLRLARVPSVILAVLLALGLILSIGGVIGTQIAQLTPNLPTYVETIGRKVETIKAFTIGHLSRFADMLGENGQQAGTSEAPGAPAGEPARQPSASPMELAMQYLSPVLSPLATIGIVVVVAIFALIQREDLRDRIIRLAGTEDLPRTTLALADGGKRVSRYFLYQLGINTCFGVAIGAALLVIGVPHPVLWGILSALLRFVPYIGAIISAVLPMTLAAAVDPGWMMVVWTAVAYLVLEGMTGQFLEPTIYGNSTGLSPFSVIVAAIFWSWLWGPVGLILSTPLTVCLVVIGRHVNRLAFLDVVLGDEPALTPPQAFYQGLVADDVGEMVVRAGKRDKLDLLTDYFDTIALPGLRLAADDAERGKLDADTLAAMRAAFAELAAALTARLPPPPENSEAGRGATVLCLPGAGALDGLAAEALAKLLAASGIAATTTTTANRPTPDASADHDLPTDIPARATMACLCHLGDGGDGEAMNLAREHGRALLPDGAPVLLCLLTGPAPQIPIQAQPAGCAPTPIARSLRESMAACNAARPNSAP